MELKFSNGGVEKFIWRRRIRRASFLRERASPAITIARDALLQLRNAIQDYAYDDSYHAHKSSLQYCFASGPYVGDRAREGPKE